MIVVGLGNPGKEYEGTFHNVGYGVVDALAKKLNKKIDKIECDSLTAVKDMGESKLVLAKPLTYMNLSGKAVKSLLGKYGKDNELIICYDDIDLPMCAVRVRKSGSAGTHNGMRSVVEAYGENVKRVRIGIGKPQYDLKDYVLSKPSDKDAENFDNVFSKVADLLYGYITDGDFDKLMREGNSIR